MGKTIALVLAAGKGSRMQSDTPKQYMMINKKPLLYYSLESFEKSTVDEIILVTGEEEIAYCRREMVERYSFSKVKKIVAGGTQRYWSVLNGLKEAQGAEYVLIHDAARPCLTVAQIEASIEGVQQYGACTLGVPVKDTIKVVDEDGMGIETPPRDSLWQIQTPQSFRYDELMKAYEKMRLSGDTDITDDTMILERYLGKKTKVLMGDYCNIKVTTIEDLSIVENFLRKIKKAVDTKKRKC